MISLAFPGTPTGAQEILLNITPIEEFLLAETVRWTYSITVNPLKYIRVADALSRWKLSFLTNIDANKNFLVKKINFFVYFL